MEEKKVNLILEPHQRPKNIGQWIILSIQHVFAMFGATVLVPMVINSLAGETVINISMALFCAGVGTLIYIALTSAKVPIYLGSSFAYMTVIGLGWQDWGNAVFIAVFAVGVVYVILGFIIHWTGSAWVKKAFSPIVIGPIVIIVGMSAVTSALQNMGLWVWDDVKTSIEEVGLNYPQWLAILIGLFTIIVAAICVLKAKSFLKAVPILMALVIGYVVVVIIHFSFSFTGIKLIETDLITDVKNWEWYPSFKNITNVDSSKIAPAVLSIVPISLITITEHLGDHINIGTLTNRDYIKDPGISRTLMADGVSIMFAGIVGGPVNATYSENTSVVGMTKIASVWVTGLAAIMALTMSFIAPINQLIMMIPKPVMGGIGVILFGLIASNGVKIMVDNKIDFSNTKNFIVLSVTLAVGVGMGVSGVAISFGNSGFQLTGMFVATVSGVTLNLLLPDQKNDGVFSIFKKKTPEEKEEIAKIKQLKEQTKAKEKLEKQKQKEQKKNKV
ncbi:uracil-xanthine permease family protein [Spiroplasma culicicola]|uniref:Uracil permease n=1 Tax=Spiroplasma culicicola AES-1 TaxID=1276246 RepID=W6A936_9MOLU|nr:solute carrier family 23 protein [Spiroplasma culicicola]AHI53405.1 uracil permease [Spiroplasma culicicola AES-1]